MADPFSEPDDTNCSSYQEEWIKIQESLKMKLVLKDDFTWTISSLSPRSVENFEVENLKYVGGTDVSFLKEDSSVACAALVVLDVESLDVVHEEFDIVRLDVPYIPGFLAFREAPILQRLLDKMRQGAHPFYPQVKCPYKFPNTKQHRYYAFDRGSNLLKKVVVGNLNRAEISTRFGTYFDDISFQFLIQMLLMVDGNGLLHPRGFGLACHLGVLADLPAIGIGKNLHHVDGLNQSGVRKLLELQQNCDKDLISLVGASGQVWGVAMCATHGSTKPIYISVGHRISLDSSVKIVKMCCKFRVPEPIRQADMRSRALVQRLRGLITTQE